MNTFLACYNFTTSHVANKPHKNIPQIGHNSQLQIEKNQRLITIQAASLEEALLYAKHYQTKTMKLRYLAEF